MAENEEGATEATPTEGAPERTGEVLTKEDVEKMIQSATDRVRTEYSRKLKDSEAEKEELKKAQMDAKQRAEYEFEQQRKENAEMKEALRVERLALDRANVITEMQIPKDLAPFVSGGNRDELESNAKDLMTAFRAAVKDESTRELVQRSAGAKPEAGTTKRVNPADQSAWNAVWSMKPGPEKQAAERKLYEALGGANLSSGG